MLKTDLTMIASMWSGGKDSCLALYKVLKSGMYVQKLISMLRNGTTAHGFGKDVLEEQAECMGVEIVFGDMENYEASLKDIVDVFKIDSIVYGDIHLQDHKNWIEKLCRKINVKPIFPLWGRDTREVAEEIIKSGFEAYVVAAKKDYRGLLCKRFDLELLKEIQELGIDFCGERGEFHTIVSYGPIFKKRLKFEFGEIFEMKDSYAVRIKIKND